MNKRIKRMATLLIILLLLALFIVPRTYLNKVCTEISALSASARQAVRLNGDPAPELARMKRAYDRSAPKLRLFLNHSSVDALGVAIVACTPLTEPEALLSALNEVEAAATHLKNIESLTPDSLF